MSEFAVDRHMSDGVYYKCKICKGADCKTQRDARKAGRNKDAITPALYVMRNPLLPHLVKIGQAVDVAVRAAALSACHPFDLEVCHQYPGQGHLEGVVHDRLRAYRFTGAKASKGREWFEVQAEQADAIIPGAIAEWELAQI